MSQTEVAGKKLLTLTDSNFEEQVLKSDVPVLVDFWAPWCGPCKAVAPILDELAGEADGRYRVGKVNVDDNHKVPSQYSINSIPTMILFKDGKAQNRLVGAAPKRDIEALLDT